MPPLEESSGPRGINGLPRSGGHQRMLSRLVTGRPLDSRRCRVCQAHKESYGHDNGELAAAQGDCPLAYCEYTHQL